MPRFFSLRQAEQLLPEVESAIREAIALNTEYQQEEGEWQRFAQRVTLLGGVQADRAGLIEKKNRRAAAAQRLKDTLEKIQEFGCLVKDLDIGLVDFPTLWKGEEVYLCWRLGESGIHFWHGVHEGFRGRKPIDGDFLDNHRGEPAN
ncbi:MAG TPA: DUF2203 domain-containing protein [Bryobacteraceae bacterium]|nr:DUF2203 domain-containing protein [Bryobacteraceae bacterium]